MRMLMLCCAAAAAIPGVGACQEPGRMGAAIDSAVTFSQPAALAALATFRHIVSAENYRAMGFDSVGDVHAATPGKPLAVFFVGLDDLRGYQRGGDPFRLLRGGDRVLYPVLLRGETRSSMTLARGNSGWKGVSYGRPVTARLAWTTLDNAVRHAPSPHRYFLIQVLALNLDFLGFEERGKLALIPLLDDPQHRWNAGDPRSADDIFSKLAGDASVASKAFPR